MPATFKVLPGLPGEGPYPEQFTTHGGTYREGFVVEVQPEAGASWVGNFQPGGGSLSRVLRHPDGRRLLVISRGQVYPVDPDARRIDGKVEDGVEDARETADRIVLVTLVNLIVIGPGEATWRSPRLSWDGIRNVRVEGVRVTGEGWDLAGWRGVEVDLATQSVVATAYEEVGPRDRAPVNHSLQSRGRLKPKRQGGQARSRAALLVSAAAVTIIFALLGTRSCRPPLTLRRAGDTLVFDLQTLGEYQTTVTAVALWRGDRLVWECTARARPPQIHAFRLKAGRNESALLSCRGGGADLYCDEVDPVPECVPASDTPFTIEPGQRYRVEVLGAAGRRFPAVIEFAP